MSCLTWLVPKKAASTRETLLIYGANEIALSKLGSCRKERYKHQRDICKSVVHVTNTFSKLGSFQITVVFAILYLRYLQNVNLWSKC